MSVVSFNWGNTAYYKIDQRVGIMSADAADGGSGIPATRARARQFALSDLAGLRAPNYQGSADNIWHPEELEIVEEDTGALAQSTGYYNVTYRIPRLAADAASQQPHVLNNELRPVPIPEPTGADNKAAIVANCPDRAAFAIHDGKYKVTVVVDNADSSSHKKAWAAACLQMANAFAPERAPGNHVEAFHGDPEIPNGTYVGTPGSPGVFIDANDNALLSSFSATGIHGFDVAGGSCRLPETTTDGKGWRQTGKYIATFAVGVNNVITANVIPGDPAAAAAGEDPSETGPAGEDPSETGPAGETSPDAPPSAPATANPDAPPGVEESTGNYIITVIVPEGEDPKEAAKDQLAKYVTDSSRARASNINVDGTLEPLSSDPAGGSGDVNGKKILIMGDSQWHGTALGKAVKESLEAKGAEVRTLWKYGKGAAVAASYWGITVNSSTGNISVSSSGLLGSMLSSFSPEIVIIGLGGNDSYGWNNKKEKYKKVLEGWITAFKDAGVEEVRWLGPSYATNLMSNGRSYDTIRQKIREHQQEYLTSSPVAGIRTTWTDTVPLTRDLERKDDGVHYVRGAAGYEAWGELMTSESGPLGDLMSGSAAGSTRVQYAVPIQKVQVTSKPPKGGTGYEPPPAAPPAGDSDDDSTKEPAEINLEPLDFQCVLMQNIRQLAAKHQSVEYLHNKRLTSDNPGNVLSIINHGNMTDEVRELLSMCPEIYGSLTPFLKIWRVEYDDKGNVLKNSDGTPKEKELRIPNFVSEHDVEDILAGRRSRISGAGLKRFSWELKGVQPAEVDNNITAKLEIYFQSVGDFFGGAEQAGGNVPNFLDLIINSPAVRKVKDKSGTGSQSPSGKPRKCGGGAAASNQYDGANFRIKVCAGWAAPEDMESMFPTMPPAKIKLLREAVMASRASLFLQQVRHNIQFNENGSLLLSIDYHAALTGMLRGTSADIFADGKQKDDIKKLRDDKRNNDQEAADEDTSDDKKKELDSDTDDLLKKIDKLEQADKLQKYRMLLKGLFASDKVMILELPAAEVYTKGIDDMTHEERVKFARERQSSTYLSGEKLRGGAFESSTLDALSDEDDLEDAAKKADKAGSKKAKQATKKVRKAKKKDTVEIPFMYLGDILDNVINQIRTNNAAPLNFAFFVSEVELIDPLVAYQVKDFADYAACGNVKDTYVLNAMEAATPGITLKGSEGLLLEINIGDIPISLDAFQKWFTDKVIKKSLDHYYFLNFIKDISSQLISNSLKSRCFGKKYKFFQRFDAQPINLGGAAELKPKKLVSDKKLASYKRKLTCESSAGESLLSIVLMSTDTKPKSLRGDFEQDLENGIYHNYIGSSCGLVKKINFNREDMPYMRESKIQKQGALGAAQLRELYSVDVDLVGNNLYRNGSYIYVSPLLLDTTMAELEFLGLHGYYMVTSVGSEVTETSFTTKIKALHEGVKFQTTKLGSTTQPAATPEPSDNPEKEKDDQTAPPPATTGPSTNPPESESTPLEQINAGLKAAGKPPITKEQAKALQGLL